MTSRMLGITWGTDRGDECSKSRQGFAAVGLLPVVLSAIQSRLIF